MWQNLRNWFTIRKVKKYKQPEDVGVISFTQALAEAQNILICLPWSYIEFYVARYVLKYISQEETNHHITYVVPGEYSTAIPTRPQDRVVRANGTSRNKSGLFVKKLEQEVLKTDYDVAADLSRPFDLGTSMLCLKSGAPLRIGIESPYSHLFFNIEYVQPNNEYPLEIAYRSIQKTLAIEDG